MIKKFHDDNYEIFSNVDSLKEVPEREEYYEKKKIKKEEYDDYDDDFFTPAYLPISSQTFSPTDSITEKN